MIIWILIFLHELSHIYCVLNECEDGCFYDKYCKNATDGGDVNAGYAVWREFVADMLAGCVESEYTALNLKKASPIVKELYELINFENPESKKSASLLGFYVMTSGEVASTTDWNVALNHIKAKLDIKDNLLLQFLERENPLFCVNLIFGLHKIVLIVYYTKFGTHPLELCFVIYNTVKEYGVPPEEILSHEFFFNHTDVFYDFYRKFFISNVEPNKAHIALAELEKMGKLKAIITQNIDGLHQKAGSKNVIELHGTAKKFLCSSCNCVGDDEAIIEEIKSGEIPKCKHCGAPMKPKVVLYGEMLYDGVAEAAIDAVTWADVLIVGGTSLAVYPAASFVRYFQGRYIVMLNKGATDFDLKCDLIFREPIGEVLSNAYYLISCLIESLFTQKIPKCLFSRK